MGADGFSRVVYETPDDLRIAKCNDAACSAPTIQILDLSAGVQSVNAKIGSDGLLRMAVTLSTAARSVLYLSCTNAECTQHTARTIDAGGTLGSMVSLQLASDNRPTIY